MKAANVYYIVKVALLRGWNPKARPLKWTEVIEHYFPTGLT